MTDNSFRIQAGHFHHWLKKTKAAMGRMGKYTSPFHRSVTLTGNPGRGYSLMVRGIGANGYTVNVVCTTQTESFDIEVTIDLVGLLNIVETATRYNKETVMTFSATNEFLVCSWEGGSGQLPLLKEITESGIDDTIGDLLELDAFGMRMLDAVSVAADFNKATGRDVLSDVCIIRSGETVSMIGLDGFRMHYAQSIPVITLPDNWPDVTRVPAGAWRLFRRLIGKADAVFIRAIPNSNSIQLGVWDHSALMILECQSDAGRYPDWQWVYNDAIGRRFYHTFNTYARFLEIMEKVAKVTEQVDIVIKDDDPLQPNTVDFVYYDNNRNRCTETYVMSDVMSPVRYSAEVDNREMSLLFNPAYLVDALRAAQSDDEYSELGVSWRVPGLDENYSPTMISCGSFESVIMPRRRG
jgi:hypothetical protein